ncbi:uncharacterized protein LOC132758926 isoform X2 [Ruditapes philippinarum]|uniref:uncharacterized protein LOC132758926 isoform X2 n=1 Tax=Ruditapes philippinarum TaxID=129788 RepID=UPI00295B8275|nr:uncharacterized protein LOC132758926 isoform X2 [Ruditapes philippinarum]
MKCSKSTCGAVGQGKFCHECGSKMIEEVKTDTVVICNGRQDNGDPCQSELVKGLKFCPNCGTKVDQSLFYLQEERCSKCSHILLTGMSFCTECGHRKNVTSKPITVEKVGETDNRGSDRMESISSSKDENANQSTALGQDVLDKEGSSDKENAQ